MTEAGGPTNKNARTCPARSFTNLKRTRSNVPATTAGLTPAREMFCKVRRHVHYDTLKSLSKASRFTSLNREAHERFPRSPTSGASHQNQHAAAGRDVRAGSHPPHADMAADGGFE